MTTRTARRTDGRQEPTRAPISLWAAAALVGRFAVICSFFGAAFRLALSFPTLSLIRGQGRSLKDWGMP